MSRQYLIVRPQDMLVVGVQWTDFEGSGTALVAGDGARVTLTFPPQTLGEEVEGPGGPFRGARISGSSQVTYAVPAGTAMTVDAAGIMAALAGATVVAGEPGSGDRSTAIELPWRLVLAPRDAAGKEVVARAPGLPVASGAGVVGLWHTRFAGSTAVPGDAGLQLVPIVALDDRSVPPLGESALDDDVRRAIVVDSSPPGALPAATRLELTTLGGTLTARGSWSDLLWEHDTVLGRDQRVRTVTKGVLYPFGHRAELTTFTERVLNPAADPATAILRKERVLTITEPVRGAVDENDPLHRRFPFAEVEVLQRTYQHLAHQPFTRLTRPQLPHGELSDRLAGLQSAQAELQATLDDILSQVPATLQAYIDSGAGSSQRLLDAQAAAASFDPDGLQQAQRDIDREIDFQERLLEPQKGPDGEPIPVDEGTVAAVRAEIDRLLGMRPTNQAIQAAIVGKRNADIELTAASDVVRREFDAIPRTIDALATAGNQTALDFQQNRRDQDAIQDQIVQITQAVAVAVDVFCPLVDSAGDPIRFPLRLAGAVGDLHVSTPLIFVKDIRLDAHGPFVPAFHALTDPVVHDALAAAYDPHVPLAGERVDLVRAPDPQPSDVHELHAMILRPVPHDGTFRTELRQVLAELPALRALLPGQIEQVPLTYAAEFLDQVGPVVELPEVALVPEFPPGAADLLVDFTGAPARAGGLVSPKFVVDGISRTLGPVPTGALSQLAGGQVPDLGSVYKDATLLGFDLGSLIKVDGQAGIPNPPKIVQKTVGGQPGVEMTWTLPLGSHGPLRAAPDSTLTVVVESSTALSTTTATVTDVTLALPTGSPLLTLHFRKITFLQEPGRMPDVSIDGFGVDFGGALQLIRTLTAGLSGLAGRGPEISNKPNGVTASYTMTLPQVSAGVFTLRNVVARAAIEVPFDRRPVVVSLSFATRDNPFQLAVLAFGGEGHIEADIGPTGLTRLEASLGFRASLGVDFVVASGEVHASGGLVFAKTGDTVSFTAYLEFGGSLKILGLVSVSVQLRLELEYTTGGNRLVGRASIVVTIDLTLYSDAVRIDSGTWVIAGDDEPAQPAIGAFAAGPDTALEEWLRYRKAFAPS